MMDGGSCGVPCGDWSVVASGGGARNKEEMPYVLKRPIAMDAIMLHLSKHYPINC